jgi:hypothetical protein
LIRERDRDIGRTDRRRQPPRDQRARTRAETSIGGDGSRSTVAFSLAGASTGDAHESKNCASVSGMKRLRNA